MDSSLGTERPAQAVNRSANSSESRHWSQITEAGTLLGLRFLLAVYHLFGRAVFRLLLLPVMIYFLLTHGTARRASRDYLATHYRYAPQAWRRKPGWFTTFRHFLAFGEAILDKILAWTRPVSKDEFSVINRPVLDTILADRRGQLIIGSHFGNLEFCRGFMSRNVDIPVNALIFDRHAGNFARLMERANPQSRINLFQVTELDIPTILLLKAKIERGEWLVIVADRTPVGKPQHTVAVEFLGRTAQFPIGPYILAATLQCPVNLMFAYRDRKSITVEFVRLAERIALTRLQREQQLQQLAQDFAARLQTHVCRAPLQWFNFYPFWDRSVASLPTAEKSL